MVLRNCVSVAALAAGIFVAGLAHANQEYIVFSSVGPQASRERRFDELFVEHPGFDSQTLKLRAEQAERPEGNSGDDVGDPTSTREELEEHRFRKELDYGIEEDRENQSDSRRSEAASLTRGSAKAERRRLDRPRWWDGVRVGLRTGQRRSTARLATPQRFRFEPFGFVGSTIRTRAIHPSRILSMGPVMGPAKLQRLAGRRRASPEASLRPARFREWRKLHRRFHGHSSKRSSASNQAIRMPS